MSGEKMLSARVPEELKELVDADRRSNQEVVRAALWREFGGERKGELERRKEEKQRRISLIESERNERERELQDARQELKAIESKLDKMQDEKKAKKEKALEKVRNCPPDKDIASVQVAAEMLGKTPEEMVEYMKSEDIGVRY